MSTTLSIVVLLICAGAKAFPQEKKCEPKPPDEISLPSWVLARSLSLYPLPTDPSHKQLLGYVSIFPQEQTVRFQWRDKLGTDKDDDAGIVLEQKTAYRPTLVLPWDHETLVVFGATLGGASIMQRWTLPSLDNTALGVSTTRDVPLRCQGIPRAAFKLEKSGHPPGVSKSEPPPGFREIIVLFDGQNTLSSICIDSGECSAQTIEICDARGLTDVVSFNYADLKGFGASYVFHSTGQSLVLSDFDYDGDFLDEKDSCRLLLGRDRAQLSMASSYQ